MKPIQMRRYSKGFTLLEVLIAFSLVSLLFLALFSSFNTVGRSWDAAEKRIEKTEDMRLINGWLRNQLRQMMVVRIQGRDGLTYAFEGEREAVRFTAPLQPFQGKGGIFLLELFVNSEGSGKSLELNYTPYRPDMSWDDAFDEAEPVLVYANLKGVKFEYLVAEHVDDEPEWRDEWLGKMHYPLLIKISIEDQNEQEWPPLIVDLPQVNEYLNTQSSRRMPKARHH